MRSDLDQLITDRDFKAIVILIDEMYNPPLQYLVGRVSVTGGLAIKKPGARPILIANPMEVEEAAAGDCEVISYNQFDLVKIREQYGIGAHISLTHMLGQTLQKLNVPAGRIGLYGIASVSKALAIVNEARTHFPEYEFVGEAYPTIFDKASATKDAQEIEIIRDIARRSSEVMEATRSFIQTHRLQDDAVVDEDGKALTIGAVKRFVIKELLDRGLQDSHMIFAQGSDAGHPHSRGKDSDVLKAGQTIVFDLFPQEMGGGYFHDATRTWCIGYAPEHIQKTYDLVRDAYDLAVEGFAVGKATCSLQEAVQDLFESKGHPTTRSHPTTDNGYTHSLGHGVGLNIHEEPSISHLQPDPVFKVGQVITIEPGLYYPENGYGIRYENTLYVAEDGSLVPVTRVSDDLVIPMRPQ